MTPNTPKIEAGPHLWRVPGRPYSERQRASGRVWTFPPYGILEGFELWLPEPLDATLDARAHLELELELRLDGMPHLEVDAVARYRNAVYGGR